jgi:hypothetical protein
MGQKSMSTLGRTTGNLEFNLCAKVPVSLSLLLPIRKVSRGYIHTWAHHDPVHTSTNTVNMIRHQVFIYRPQGCGFALEDALVHCFRGLDGVIDNSNGCEPWTDKCGLLKP